ncbi:MAG: glucuronate isomerase [Sedimentisphaerales bacterium]|nr:glucuronate isomerase [Sedimentisphaerales bacterium]
MAQREFLSDDFSLTTETAKRLYHEHAAKMPIYDYHCHLPVRDLAEDKQWENLTQIWLYGDHYKWRGMRTNGVAERYCTGDASDWEKFEKWAETVPYTVRNPLFVWTHLELKRYFGVDKVLNKDTAREIYEHCNALLRTKEFSARNILRKMNVKVVCSTDDPIDDLEHHRKLADDGFEVKVLPTWRPDKGMAVEDAGAWNGWIDKLEAAADMSIADFGEYMEALRKRHEFFHENGCRISDHGLETAYAEEYNEGDIRKIFDRLRAGEEVSGTDQLKFKSAMLYEFGVMDYEKGWVQQFHFGAIRNNSTRLFEQLGADTGFDSIGDFEIGRPLSRLLDRLDQDDKLAKTILYALNPRDNELLATMVGNFQDGSVPGKLQFGSGWWFNDQRDGMVRQMNALSNMGLLSRFVGMLTDSRSFMSYPRHEYFRRVLCDLIGQDVALGELPMDMGLLGEIVENISFNNARDYFGIELPA